MLQEYGLLQKVWLSGAVACVVSLLIVACRARHWSYWLLAFCILVRIGVFFFPIFAGFPVFDFSEGGGALMTYDDDHWRTKDLYATMVALYIFEAFLWTTAIIGMAIHWRRTTSRIGNMTPVFS